MSYINLQEFGDAEISKETMGVNNYSLGPILCSSSSGFLE